MRIELGYNFGDYFKFSIKVRANGTSLFSHQADAFKPPTTLFIQFCPSSFLGTRTESLKETPVYIFSSRVDPTEAQSLFYSLVLPRFTAIQHSFSVALLFISHLRKSLRFVISRIISGFIFSFCCSDISLFSSPRIVERTIMPPLYTILKFLKFPFYKISMLVLLFLYVFG